MSELTTIDPLGLEAEGVEHRNGSRNGASASAPTNGAISHAERVAEELEDASAEEALEWAIETFHPRLYVASSFQKTSSVIVDMGGKMVTQIGFFYLARE